MNVVKRPCAGCLLVKHSILLLPFAARELADVDALMIAVGKLHHDSTVTVLTGLRAPCWDALWLSPVPR
jgi:hypothetical protein